MKIVIKKNKMKDKKNYCKSCGSFLFNTKENKYIEFRDGLSISSNGTEFKIKCKCGHETVIVID